MRKRAFTLAEVLITLVIIGVISSITIPDLITNIQDAHYKTAWKKAYSDLNQATNKLKIDNGGSLKGFFENGSDMVNKFSTYFSSTKNCPFDNDGCWHLANEWYNLNRVKATWGNRRGIILGNGNLLTFSHFSQDCTDTSVTGNNMPICGFMYNDINGFKRPNTIGKDIYLIWIRENGLSPAGYNDDHDDTCNAGSSGWGCAAIYLMQ